MRYWRMAMRFGNQGEDRFPCCRAAGVAAMGYSDAKGRHVVTDCRKLSREQYEQKWRRKWPRSTSPRASLRRLWLDVKPGDIIYAKTGPRAVGKGRVVKPYAYDEKLCRHEFGPHLWPHYVTVEWQNDFAPFDFHFRAPQHTLLELKPDELRRLQALEAAAGRRSSRP